MTDELLEYPTTLSWTRGMTKKRRSVYERAEETDQVDQGTQKMLIIAGISIASLIAIVLGIKNSESIKALWSSLRKVTEKAAAPATRVPPLRPVHPVVENTAAVAIQNSETIPFDVAKHIRNLPDGWHASADKIATALENGFELAEGQTWVVDYMKGMAA